MRLDGRVAIVTGGARQYSRRLAEEGAAVVIANVLDGQAVANDIRLGGAKRLRLRSMCRTKATPSEWRLKPFRLSARLIFL